MYVCEFLVVLVVASLLRFIAKITVNFEFILIIVSIGKTHKIYFFLGNCCF